MTASEELKALVNQIPDPDEGGFSDGRYLPSPDEGGTFRNIEGNKVEEVIARIHKGGRENILGLIDMLVEPGKGDDFKARFALHLLAVLVTRKGNEQARSEFAQAVASQIGGDRPKAIQIYLIEQLQLAGSKAVIATLGKALLDPELCDTAARALTSIRDGAAEQLLSVLPNVQERQRLSVINSLAYLRAAQAADAFRQAFRDPDPDTRIAAAWGIARIADPSAAEVLLKCAEAHRGWERINETDACLALAENLVAVGKRSKAAAIYTHLQRTRTELSERHVYEAAERGMMTAR